MLRTWFRWRSNNTVRKKPTVISLATSKSRTWQDSQVYSKLFYESKLKVVVDRELDGKNPTKGERLARVIDVAKREWENESDEVKEIVRAKKEEMEIERELPGDKRSQAAIDNLSQVVGAFLKHVKQTTGWTAFLVAGGPNPDLDGALSLAS
jgi:hypothetical protein